MNDKKPFFLFLFIFIVGLALGLFLGLKGPGFFRSRGRTDADLRERFEQVSRDLKSAIDAQREAERRATRLQAERLQAELQGIADQARIVEEGTRRAQGRADSIAGQLDVIIDQSGELSSRINRASTSLEESRILLDELGTVVRGLQGDD